MSETVLVARELNAEVIAPTLDAIELGERERGPARPDRLVTCIRERVLDVEREVVDLEQRERADDVAKLAHRWDPVA